MRDPDHRGEAIGMGEGMREVEHRVRVVGGKSLVLRAECRGEEVTRLRLRGDFFFFPEEGLEQLESFLLSSRAWTMEDPRAMIERFMREQGLRAAGFGPSDVADLLREMRC